MRLTWAPVPQLPPLWSPLGSGLPSRALLSRLSAFPRGIPHRVLLGPAPCASCHPRPSHFFPASCLCRRIAFLVLRTTHDAHRLTICPPPRLQAVFLESCAAMWPDEISTAQTSATQKCSDDAIHCNAAVTLHRRRPFRGRRDCSASPPAGEQCRKRALPSPLVFPLPAIPSHSPSRPTRFWPYPEWSWNLCS